MYYLTAPAADDTRALVYQALLDLRKARASGDLGGSIQAESRMNALLDHLSRHAQRPLQQASR